MEHLDGNHLSFFWQVRVSWLEEIDVWASRSVCVEILTMGRDAMASRFQARKAMIDFLAAVVGLSL